MADSKSKVVKLAQPGFDVKSAGDENLIYNSNWPLLKIYKQGSFTTSDNATERQVVINHDLGYVPAFWAFTNASDTDWATSDGITAERSEFNGQFQFFPAVTADKLVFDINPGFITGTIKFYYYIFALDITKLFEAPVTKTGGQTGAGSGNKVFKVAKENKDISSRNLEDYSIHSDARSPLIHAVYPAVTGSDATVPGGIGWTYYHNLGYIPMVFAYQRTDFVGVNNPTPNSWIAAPVDASLGSAGLKVDKQKIQNYFPAAGQHTSIVILKDPFTVDHSIDVNI